MEKAVLMALIKRGLLDSMNNRPYVEVADLLWDDPFMDNLADAILEYADALR